MGQEELWVRRQKVLDGLMEGDVYIVDTSAVVIRRMTNVFSLPPDI